VNRFYPTDHTVILQNTKDTDEILVIVSNVDTAGTSNEYKLEVKFDSYIQVIYSGLIESQIYKSNETRIVFFSEGQYSPTEDLNYDRLNNINIRTGLNRSMYIEGYPSLLGVGNHAPFWWREYDPQPDVDNNKVWLYGAHYKNGEAQATGLYTISTIDLSVSNIFEKEIHSAPDSFPTLRAFHISNWTYRDLDGNPTTPFFDNGKFYKITRFATGKKHVIWTRTYWKDFNAYWNGDYPDSSMILLYKLGDSSPVILHTSFGGVDDLSSDFTIMILLLKNYIACISIQISFI